MHPRVYHRHHGNAPPGAIYVGRRTSWGNPFTVAEHGPDAMRLYLDWLRDESGGQSTVVLASVLLRGQALVCSCVPRRPCHAEVLARLADGDVLEAIRADVLAELERASPQRELFS